MSAAGGGTLEDLPADYVASMSAYDLNNHDSIAPWVTKTNTIMLVFVSIIVILRVWIRLLVVRTFTLDDILIIFATATQFVLSVLCLYGSTIGIGKHSWDIAPFADLVSHASILIKIFMVSQIFYSTSAAFVKCSIMACYLRVFPNKTFRKVVFITGGVVVANWICAVLINIFQCRPVDAAWNFTVTRRDCVDVVAFYTFSGSINAVTDLVLCTAPLPLLWMLKVQKRERLIISGLFGCGYVASAFSFVRLSSLHQLYNVGDFSQSIVPSLNWSVIEVGIGIMCASVPSLRPLIARFLPSLPPPTRCTRVTQTGRFEFCSDDEDNGSDPFRLGYTAKITANPPKSKKGGSDRARATSFKDTGWMTKMFETSEEIIVPEKPGMYEHRTSDSSSSG